MKLSLLFSVLLIVAASKAGSHDEFLKYSDTETLSWFSYIKLIVKEIVHVIWHWNDICHGHECPEYTYDQNSTSEYQRRCYPAYAWAGTASEDTEMPSGDMFLRLYRYFGGDNYDGVKMSMTVPVMIKVQEIVNSTKRYTMLFFMPYEYQTTPPQPNNTLVSIVRIPETCFYVKRISGHISGTVITQTLEKLVAALKKDGIADYIEPDALYFYGGFNRPWTLSFFRTTDIMIVQRP